jgi:DNA-binding NarL/FixJ family response regulator
VDVRCLIVDDNQHFLDAAEDLLSLQGADVVGRASSCREALEQAAALRPDVALVDIDLGEESGFDLARALTADPDGPVTRVVLTSAHGEEELVELIDASPAAGFVAKSELSLEAILACLIPPARPGDGPIGRRPAG